MVKSKIIKNSVPFALQNSQYKSHFYVKHH